MKKTIMAMVVILTMMFAASVFAEDNKANEQTGLKYNCKIVNYVSGIGILEYDLNNVSIDDAIESIMTKERPEGLDSKYEDGSAEYVCSQVEPPNSYSWKNYYFFDTLKVVHGKVDYDTGDISVNESICKKQNAVGKSNIAREYNHIRDDAFPNDKINCFDFLKPGWEKEAKIRVQQSLTAMKKRESKAYHELHPKKRCNADGTLISKGGYDTKVIYRMLFNAVYKKQHSNMEETEMCKLSVNNNMLNNSISQLQYSNIEILLNLIAPLPVPTFGQKLKEAIVCGIFNM